MLRFSKQFSWTASDTEGQGKSTTRHQQCFRTWACSWINHLSQMTDPRLPSQLQDITACDWYQIILTEARVCVCVWTSCPRSLPSSGTAASRTHGLLSCKPISQRSQHQATLNLANISVASNHRVDSHVCTPDFMTARSRVSSCDARRSVSACSSSNAATSLSTYRRPASSRIICHTQHTDPSWLY